MTRVSTQEKDFEKLPDLLTISEVADILRVDDTTVRRWAKQGVLESMSLPHTGKRNAYRIKKTTVHRILHGNNAEVEYVYGVIN